MKIPDLFFPEYKQSLRLIMRRQSETNTVTFSPRHERGRVIWLKKKARMGSINSSVLNHKKKEN